LDEQSLQPPGVDGEDDDVDGDDRVELRRRRCAARIWLIADGISFQTAPRRADQVTR
jgi:hypothetical protein